MSGRTRSVGGTRVAAVLAVAAACSSAPSGPGGVAGLELLIPFPAVVDQNDTITLRGLGLKSDGDTVAAVIVWWTPDDTVIALNSMTGQLSGLATSGTGRVQGQSGPYVSDLIPFTVRPSADTIAFPGSDTLRVLLTDTASAPLVAQVLSFNPPGGAAGRLLIYTVVLPVFTDPTARTVQLPGGVLADTITTQLDGGSLLAITLRRVPGVPSPDSAMVEVASFRPSGTPVPGTGHRFTVRFDNP